MHGAGVDPSKNEEKTRIFYECGNCPRSRHCPHPSVSASGGANCGEDGAGTISAVAYLSLIDCDPSLFPSALFRLDALPRATANPVL